MAESEFLKGLLAFIQDNGFIWGPEPEIYGGTSGFYTYGPLGKLLKNNIENAIRDVFSKNGFYEVECPTVMEKVVWEASGHLGNFSDPVITCTKCKANSRVDHLLKEQHPDIKTEGLSEDDIRKIIETKGLKCPSCKTPLPSNIKRHSLMMRTTIGLDTEAYNRPETATTTYLPFMRYANFFRGKFPFGVFQIGKAYRNEISPRQHVLRGREFTQAEGQFFIFPEQKNAFEPFEHVKNKELPLWTHQQQSAQKDPRPIKLSAALQQKLIKSKAYAWSLAIAYELFSAMGIPKDKIRFRQHHPDEKAFYADDAWDVEIQLTSFGWTEVCGIHDRTDYDLTQHAKYSKKELSARDEKNNKLVPHILEIAFGTDRPAFALLDLFYKKNEREDKTVFKIPYRLSPIKCAVFALVNKDGLPETAEKVFNDLQKVFICQYDKSGSIGRRYARQDEIGTPFCITIDHQSLQDSTVTVRDRDTTEQARVSINVLRETLRKLLAEEIAFKSLK